MKPVPRKQRLSQMQTRLEQLEDRALLTAVSIGFGTGVHVFDVAGYKFFQDNASFQTTSSAFGFSEASMTQPQQVTTLGGGTVSSTLNDGYDGVFSFGPIAEVGMTNFVTYRDLDGIVDITGNSVTGDFESSDGHGGSFNGLQLAQQNSIFALSPTEPVARMIYAIHNPTAEPITQIFGVYNNFGSDANTVYYQDSSGDASFQDGTDRWFASFQNYSGTTSSDPRQLTVVQGTGTVASPADSAGNISNVNDNPNIYYTVTLNPGETKYIMQFNALFASKAAAVNTGNTVFADNQSVINAGLLAGIDPSQYGNIVNWNLQPQSNISVNVSDGSGSSNIVPGSTVKYTVVVTNNGSTTATGVQVNESFTQALSNVKYTAVGAGGATGFRASGTGPINQNPNALTGLTLPAGASVTYTVTGTVSAAATGSFGTTVTAGLPGIPDVTPEDNSVTDTDILTPLADVWVGLSDNLNTPGAGQTIKYTLVVSNKGPSVATGTAVNFQIPAGLMNATWTSSVRGSVTGNCPPFGCGDINQVLSIAPGATITYTITARVGYCASGLITATASATLIGPHRPYGDVIDTNGSNNSATDLDRVSGVQPAISLIANIDTDPPTTTTRKTGTSSH